MCLVIHKPARSEIPDELLVSAAAFNPHGFGIMSFGPARGLAVQRRSRTRLADVRRLYRNHINHESVLHLRYRTRGSIDLENTQPLRVTRDIFLVHNGTLSLPHTHSAWSDTWHFIRDYLRPILRHRPDVLHEPSFQELIKCWAGQNNRFIFMDARHRKTVIINQEAGRQIDALWISNTRWFDASRFDWYRNEKPSAVTRQKMEFFA